MAFIASDMKRLNFGGRSLYWYHTTDPILTVVASGYFNSFAAELRDGDVTIVTDTTANTVDLVTVTSADGATPVTTVNGT